MYRMRNWRIDGKTVVGEAWFSLCISGLYTRESHQYLDKEFERLKEEEGVKIAMNKQSGIRARHTWCAGFWAKFEFESRWDEQKLIKRKHICFDDHIDTCGGKLRWGFTPKQAELIEKIKAIRERAYEIEYEVYEARFFPPGCDACLLYTAEAQHFMYSDNHYLRKYKGGKYLVVRRPKIRGILRVPRDLAGRVIGRGGSQIKVIQEFFKCRIKVVVVDE